MTVKVGVIGIGMIGTEHVKSLTTEVADATVTTLFDVDEDRAARVAQRVGAVATTSAEELIHHDDVEAVVIATPSLTHAELVLDCLSLRKPMLCEKPLATNADDCVKILEVETAIGRHLVQVGFMRRFDSGYREVKDVIATGAIGEPLLAHMYHRTADVPAHFNDEMVMNDSLVHEIDATRWLLNDEIVAARALVGRSMPGVQAGLQDPQVLILETASGALVIAEAFVASGFGYDVRCEVLGSEGVVELTTPRLSTRTTKGVRSERIARSWKERFGESYRLELQTWVEAVKRDTHLGPDSWDGYAATVVAEAGVTAQRRPGERVIIDLAERPDLYA